jgi:alpha-tubulin suppressor-like RCC1 family protein
LLEASTDAALSAVPFDACLDDANCFSVSPFDDSCAREWCLDTLLACVGEDELPVGEPDLDWARVSAGRYHSCAIKKDGRMFCWGRGANGRLGRGNTTDSKVPVAVASEDMDWTSVSANEDHTCAISSEGRLYCWGMGNNGRLGNGNTSDRQVPTEVTGGHTDWSVVTTGYQHTCAIRSTTSTLYCWGNGGNGRLGTGSTSTTHVPLAVVAPLSSSGFTTVSAGDRHTCAISTDQKAWCFGDGGFGRLGNGDDNQSSSPVQVSGQEAQWLQIEAGEHHSCGLTTSGRIFCWGWGNDGRLGRGSNSSSDVPVEVSGNHTTWTSLSVGYQHACAVRGVASVKELTCWGDGSYGKLGLGSSSDVSVPTTVSLGDDDWIDVDAGRFHTCARKGLGSIFCWGYGGHGRLGNGSTSSEDTPVEVASTD